jgi:hypothetical protein
VRLTSPPAIEHAGPVDVALDRLKALEAEFAGTLGPMLRSADGSALEPRTVLGWAPELSKLAEEIDRFELWRDFEAQVLAPRISRAVATLDTAFRSGGVEVWTRFRAHYLSAIQAVTRAIAKRAASRSTERLAAIDRVLASHGLAGGTLSERALRVLRGVGEIDVVLVGMRSARYVEEVTHAAQGPAGIDDVRAVLESLRRVAAPS